MSGAQIIIKANPEAAKVEIRVQVAEPEDEAFVDITASPAAARGQAVRLLAAADRAEGLDRPVWVIQNNVPEEES